jgi:hypothetical protein
VTVIYATERCRRYPKSAFIPTLQESTVAKSEVNPIPLESAAPVEISHTGTAREVYKPSALPGHPRLCTAERFDRGKPAELVLFNSCANEIPRLPEVVRVYPYLLLLFQFALALRLT